MTNITASDFSRYKISDRQETCASCHVPNHPTAVVIDGMHYCVWCALEIARELLAVVA
jgi:hypothetical protein